MEHVRAALGVSERFACRVLGLRDLGPAALDAALEGYGAAPDEAALRARALFHARCKLVEDWAYGVRTGRPAYAAKSRAAAARLFPE